MQFSRRSFLKFSALGAVSAAAGPSLLTEAKASVTPADYGSEKKVHMACRMCAQFCPMVGRVKNGKLIAVDANPHTPYPAVCGRGRAAPAALYNPSRLKTPLILEGEKGSGKFRAASWSEALDLAASKMKELRDKGMAHTLAYFPRFNTAPVLDNAIITHYGSSNVFGYADTCFASANELGLGSVFGGGPVPRPGTSAVMGDYENAKLAVLISRNPAGGLVAFPWGAMFGRGRKNGLKTVVIDPRKPYGVGETDTMWLPVTPGTDVALLNALANVIISKKYYDENFIKEHTNADMLIDPETLAPLEVINPYEKDADYLVYDTDKKMAIMKSASSNPAIEGEFELGGKKVITAFQALINSSAKYTPEEAEKICGVKAEQIIKLAEELNAAKPACFLERGYRATRYFNSTKEKQTIAMINALLGAYGAKGGLIYGRNVKTASPFKPNKTKETFVTEYYAKNVKGFELINKKQTRRLFPKAVEDQLPFKMTMAFINGQNPVGGGAGGYETAKALAKMDTVIAIAPYWSETLLFADIILPDCTFMERDEPVYSSYKATFPVMSINRKAVEPMFDTKNGYWIMTQLAKRIFSPEEYGTLLGDFEKGGIDYIINYQLANISGMTDEEKASFSKDDFLMNGVWTGQAAPVKPKPKNTATGKFEVYPNFMAEWNLKLKKENRMNDAEYFSPVFQWAPPYWKTKKETLEKGEFIPITGFNPLGSFGGAQTRDNILLKTIGDSMDYGAVFINEDKGRELDLNDGDLIEIFNIEKPDLITVAKVKLTQTVEPHSLFSFYCIGNGYFKELSDNFNVASPIGFNPNHISNLNFPPLDGTSPSQDFIVKIRRLTV